MTRPYADRRMPPNGSAPYRSQPSGLHSLVCRRRSSTACGGLRIGSVSGVTVSEAGRSGDMGLARGAPFIDKTVAAGLDERAPTLPQVSCVARRGYAKDVAVRAAREDALHRYCSPTGSRAQLHDPRGRRCQHQDCFRHPIHGRSRGVEGNQLWSAGEAKANSEIGSHSGGNPPRGGAPSNGIAIVSTAVGSVPEQA
jgi:hypothetical protein